jgi:dipeptidyl aminopeptidase/acylaminoacyl peptidase
MLPTMPKKLEVESLYGLNFVSDPQISIDGKLVAFVVSSTQEDKKGYESRIYLSRNGREAQAFSSGKKDSSPRFSPDASQLAFTRGMGEDKPQLYVMPLNGGEARALTKLKSGVANPRYSKDGSKIAFLSRGDWEDVATKDGLPRVVTTLRYKSNGLKGAGILPDEALQLWVYDLETEETTRVTHHPVSVEAFDWVDEDHLVFLAPVSLEGSSSWGNEAFSVRLGKKKAKQLTRWGGAMTSIAVSPDGSRAAVIADPDFGTQPGDVHVYTFPLQKNASLTRVSSADVYATQAINSDSHLGAYPMGPCWLEDGSLVVLHQFGGAGVVTRLTLKGDLERLPQPGDSSTAAFAASRDGTVVTLLESNTQPLEVYVGTGKRAKRVSNLNDLSSAGISSDLEHVTLERDGFTVEGWVLKPTGWKASKKYPVVLNIHGGPATAWGHGYMHEFQLMAAHGYAVAFCNIRGSVGYGDTHTAGTRGQYFQGDYDDLMAFLDACLERFPWLDAKRAAVVGGSYGGVMTNWIVSHTERFKAAITDRCISNWISFHGSSDIGYRFTAREIKGVVPQDADRLWEMSPLKHAANVKTPCLIVHAEEDYRCPIEQAEQWFVALKSRGVATRFVRVPGENHDLSRLGRPDRRVFRLKEYLDWLERWL